MSDGILYGNNIIFLQLSGNTCFQFSSSSLSCSNYNTRIGNFSSCKTVYQDTILTNYDYKILVDTSLNNVVINFPSAIENLSKQYVINMISGSNNMLINSLPPVTSSGTVYVFSDGENWLPL